MNSCSSMGSRRGAGDGGSGSQRSPIQWDQSQGRLHFSLSQRPLRLAISCNSSLFPLNLALEPSLTHIDWFCRLYFLGSSDTKPLGTCHTFSFQFPCYYWFDHMNQILNFESGSNHSALSRASAKEWPNSRKETTYSPCSPVNARNASNACRTKATCARFWGSKGEDWCIAIKRRDSQSKGNPSSTTAPSRVSASTRWWTLVVPSKLAPPHPWREYAS